MSLKKRLLRLGFITLLTPVVYLLGCQARLIYHPNRYRAEYHTLLKTAKGERLEFKTGQGKQTAFYIPPRVQGPTLPQTVWICFSGNGSLALDWLYAIPEWNEHHAYLLVDYPSYGDCQGSPTPDRIRESGKAAVARLAVQLGVSRELLQPRLAVLGHSLGAAAALMTADELSIPRGVLISPFTTMTEMGRLVLGWPLCHLNRHPFDNRRTLRRVATLPGARFEIFHGEQDEVIPVRMGRELAAAHPAVVTFHPVPEAHHNDVLAHVSGEVGLALDRVAASAP